MSFRGITVSQLEALFSQARTTALWVLEGRASFTSAWVVWRRSSFALRVFVWIDLMTSSSGISCSWRTICWTRGSVIAVDALNSYAAFSTGLISPSPPKRTGKANRLRSASVQICPVSSGIKASLIARSSGSNKSSMSGSVRKGKRKP